MSVDGEDRVWFRVPLRCLLGSTVIGFVGDCVTIDSVPGLTSSDERERPKHLVFVCSLEDADKSTSIAVVDGTETVFRSRVHVVSVSGAIDNADLQPRLVFRVRLPLEELDGILRGCGLHEEIFEHVGSPDPLNVCPICDCGVDIFGMEEPPAGRGFMFSWCDSQKTTADRFALQEWGMLVSHPCRVVALSPPDRLFQKQGCVPLVECVDVACARFCLAILEEIEQCCMMVKEDSPIPGSSSPDSGIFHDSKESARARAVASQRSASEYSCPLEKEPFYVQLLRSTNTDPAGSQVFGMELDAVCARERDREGQETEGMGVAPMIVSLCCQDILAHRTEINGIFRQSGNQGTVKALRAVFNRGVVPRVFGVLSDNYSTVALLKNYLLSLPSSVIPWNVAQKLVEMTKSPEGKVGAVLPEPDQVQALFSTLSPNHLATLREVLLVVSAIVSKAEVNNMTAKNLSVCISPCLAFKESKELGQSDAMLEELGAMNNVISAMVPFVDNATMFYTILSRI